MGRTLTAARFPTLALLVGVVLAGAGVSAQSAVGLAVQVVNRTPGAGVGRDLPVTLYQVTGDQQTVVGRGQTDGRGTFAWAAPAGPVNARYVISTSYAGVAYHSDPVTLPAPAITLPVYEPTPDDALLGFSRVGLALVGVDAATQRLQVLETLTLHNSGTRTFVPSTTGPRGPMGLLRFGLPDGAGHLTLDAQLAAQTVIQVNNGFATDLPVPPGDTALSYTYDLSYGALPDGGYALLSTDFPYASDAVQLLVPQDTYSVQSPELGAPATTTVGSRSYRVFTGQHWPAHGAVTLELRNLPLNQPILRSSNPWLQLLIGGLLLGAVGFPVLYRRWYLRSGLPP